MAFLAARSHPVPALIFAMAFLLISLVPMYMVQFMPDFFIFAMVLFGYFFWCYKEAAARADEERPSWRTRWLMGPRSDVVAAVLLGDQRVRQADQHRVDPAAPGIGGAAPAVDARLADRRGVRRRRGGLFAVNMAITGDWNYQGGDRKTFYSTVRRGFQAGSRIKTNASAFDTVGIGRVDDGSVDVLVHARRAARSLSAQPWLLPVRPSHRICDLFLPGVMAILLFLVTTRDRAMWQWLTLAAGVGTGAGADALHAVHLVGGGGPVGNRYFLGTYGVFLFLVPPLQTAVAGLLATGDQRDCS